MNHRTKTLFYICTVFFITLLFFSCEDSGIGPTGVPADERILFIKYDDTITEICSIKPDGTNLQTIASHNTAGEFIRQGYHQAEWSPDKSILVVVGGPNDQLEFEPLWIMDNDGNLLYRVTADGGGPRWSSGGNEILFSRRKSYFSFLNDYYIVNIHTLNKRLILASDNFSWAGADWSADNKYILTTEQYYWINEEGKQEVSDQEVVLLQLSNGERLQLTDTDMMDFEPRWSPDESNIAYISGRYGQGYQIKLMNSDGSAETTVVDTIAGYNTVRLSPDGDKIVFNKRDKLEYIYKYAKGSDLFVLDINSGTTKQLTYFESDSIDVFVQDWK